MLAGQGLDDVGVLLQLVDQHTAEHLGHADAGFPGSARLDLDIARHRADVQDRIGQCHCRLPVDCRMVQLRVQGKALLLVGTRGQTFEDMKLPQRTVAVEQHRVPCTDLGFKLGQPAAFAQLDGDDVLAQIRRCIDTHRVADVERHLRQLAAQGRHQRQAHADVLAQVGHETALVAGRQLEQVQCAHMHRHLGRLHVQQAGVQA